MTAIFKAANTAVITGGASGIGLALAKKCAGHGMKVLIADRDSTSLAAVPKAVGGAAHNVSVLAMDVSKPSDWDSLKSKIQSELGGKISLLALNAGTTAKTSLVDSPDLTDFHKIIDTNFFGVVNGISALLPLLREGATQDSPTSVVITGSKQGITNPPGNPAYNASKAAVKTVAEHLSWDLRDTNVNVHLLVPGWTWTGIAGGVAGGLRDNEKGASSGKPDAAWWPEQVVDFLSAKMDQGHFWVLCPDNEVTEDMDRKRMAWTMGDATQGRKPLSRWRAEYKDEAAAWMSN